MTLYEAFWFFILYAFIGWCVEVIYAAACCGKFVNRGFLYGPICPIYGFGMVLVLFCLGPISSRLFLLFVCATLLTSLLELAAGFVLERFFHEKWWDYSDFPFNIGGYVCLKFSLLWGLGCMLAVKVLHPVIAGALILIPHPIGRVLLGVAAVLVAADLTFTVIGLSGLRAKLAKIAEFENILHVISDRVRPDRAGEPFSLTEITQDIKAVLDARKMDAAELISRYKNLVFGSNFINRRIFRAYPLIERKFRAAQESLTERIKVRLHMPQGAAENAEAGGTETAESSPFPPNQEGENKHGSEEQGNPGDKNG